MKNRELTYYSLSPREDLRNKFYTADTMDSQGFIDLGFDEKWRSDLWIAHNNEAFLGLIGNQVNLKRIDTILNEQLKLYARKHREGCEENKEDIYKIYEARKDWLRHTIFICQNEYNKTRNEIFAEAVKWCEKWKKEWLETFNPNSLDESTIKQKVKNTFSFMQEIDPRSHKLILNETDFNNLVKYVTYYFINGFKLPKNLKPIKKINTNKGNVVYTFIKFFKEEHPTKTRPDSLFELIIACFNEYRNDKLVNMKKTKEPQYYKELISKNN